MHLSSRLIAGLAVIAAFAASPGLAATNGTLGQTSTGSVGLSVTVPQRAMITGLTDVTFASADPLSVATNSQDVCVWSNTNSHTYSITATGSGTGSALTISPSSGTGTAVPYNVLWASSPGQTNGTALTASTALAAQTSSTSSPTCSGGGKTASLTINVPTTSLQAMTATVAYTGTLTLLVTPQ